MPSSKKNKLNYFPKTKRELRNIISKRDNKQKDIIKCVKNNGIFDDFDPQPIDANELINNFYKICKDYFLNDNHITYKFKLKI